MTFQVEGDIRAGEVRSNIDGDVHELFPLYEMYTATDKIVQRSQDQRIDDTLFHRLY